MNFFAFAIQSVNLYDICIYKSSQINWLTFSAMVASIIRLYMGQTMSVFCSKEQNYISIEFRNK